MPWNEALLSCLRSITNEALNLEVQLKDIGKPRKLKAVRPALDKLLKCMPRLQLMPCVYVVFSLSLISPNYALSMFNSSMYSFTTRCQALASNTDLSCLVLSCSLACKKLRA